jgi:hypothetical protein
MVVYSTPYGKVVGSIPTRSIYPSLLVLPWFIGTALDTRGYPGEPGQY